MTEQTPQPLANGHTTTNGAAHTNGSAQTNGSALPPKQDDSQQPNGTSKADSKPQKNKGRPSGGFDSTKLPSAPRGYTLRFTFHSAKNLAPGDINTASSDPYLHATLKVAGLKRHKEDPDLTHRTRTIRRTLEPQWDDQWVVANVPPTGFILKCRLYDEDSPDKDDRLGNVTIRIPRIHNDWVGIPPPGRTYQGKKRVMSKRAFVLKAITDVLQSNTHMAPLVTISIELLGPSDPPHGHMYTVGPTGWVQHFSPMIGRLAGTKVDDKKDEEDGDAVQGDGEQQNQAESSNAGKEGNKIQSESSKASKEGAKTQRYE